MVEDRQLIAQYAADGAEAAFAELVRRHLDLVYATALRQVNGDSHLAEDITQSVFADLARKSGELMRSASIGGWLYTSARFAASKAVRSETRRRAREEAAVAMIDADTSPPNASNDLRSLLDDALGQLDEPDRDAVVLRYFETADFSAVGAALGVSQNAARMRVERALDKLRAIIEKRGLTTTSAVVAATLSEWAGKAAPAGLAAQIVRSAAIPAAGAGAALPPLAKVFGLAKSKFVAGAAVLGILAATAYMVPTLFNNTGGAQIARRPSDPSAASKADEQTSAIQMPRGDSHAFQRLLERHGARAQLEHAKHVQAAEAAWDKAQTQLTDWIHATNAPGVTRFGASVRATVPFGQSLLTGGWNTEPGRRTVALMTITQIDAAGNRAEPGTVSGQIMVQYQIGSAPIAMLDKLGLQALNSPDNQSAISLQMPSAEAELIVKKFEADSDTDVLSAPRITTTDETAAEVSTVNNEIVAGRQQELGIRASIQPIQVTADGSGMDVGIIVRYAMRTPAALAPSSPPGLNASSSGGP